MTHCNRELGELAMARARGGQRQRGRRSDSGADRSKADKRSKGKAGNCRGKNDSKSKSSAADAHRGRGRSRGRGGRGGRGSSGLGKKTFATAANANGKRSASVACGSSAGEVRRSRKASLDSADGPQTVPVSASAAQPLLAKQPSKQQLLLEPDLMLLGVSDSDDSAPSETESSSSSNSGSSTGSGSIASSRVSVVDTTAGAPCHADRDAGSGAAGVRMASRSSSACRVRPLVTSALCPLLTYVGFELMCKGNSGPNAFTGSVSNRDDTQAQTVCEPGPEREALELDPSCAASQLPAPASMEELSRWHHFNAAVVARELGPEGVQRYLRNASGLILNSDYSGMGGAEIGLHYGVVAMESLSAKPGGLLA